MGKGKVLDRERDTHTEGRYCEKTQGRCHVKTEAEIEIMLPQTQERLGLSEVGTIG